jgi:hypothetical protein
MALALLDLVGTEGPGLRFRIDTGTNRYYRLKLGRDVRDRSGVEWIDDVVFETPLQATRTGSGLLDTAMEVVAPGDRLEPGRGYAQLFSFKTSEGRAPAFSAVVRVGGAMSIPGADYVAPESTEMQETMHINVQSFEHPRPVSSRTCAEQLGSPTFGDLLSQIVKVAGPIVMGVIGSQGAAPGTGTAPAGAVGAGAPGADLLAGLVNQILKLIPGLAAPAAAPQATAAPSLSAATSIGTGNRFGNAASPGLARPFVFGIDDVLLGAVIGQVVQVLPQLQNAANQKRIQMQAQTNKLVSDVIAGVNQRMLLDRVLQAQSQASGAQASDLAKLAELLQQAGAGVAPSPNGTPAAPATTQSVAPGPHDPTLSNRAVATFVTRAPLAWNGAPHLLFAKGQAIELEVSLTVAEPAPKTPLPKAIIRVVVKDPADQSVVAEKVVKQKDLAANGSVHVTFSEAQLARVPAGRPVSILAEIRWLTSSGAERTALGSTEAVFVEHHFVKERTGTIGDERELTDMDRFRPFWNKIWESPALDAAAGKPRQLLWELDANLRYTVLIAPDHDSNGVMETKFLVATKDPEAVTDRTEGRMKAGVELSVAELGKLAPLWGDEPVLDAARLDAFRTADFAKATASELIHRVKLKGRAAERGLVWIVPVFRLGEFILGSVDAADASGQVTAVTEEKVRLPLPVAARILELTSSDEETAADDESSSSDPQPAPPYAFAGFKIEVSEKVALLPPGAAAAPAVQEVAARG